MVAILPPTLVSGIIEPLQADRNKALLLMNKGSGEISIVFNRFENESYGVLVESYD